ncbi:cytochrome c biogenesis protein ResB [Jatrophihabitans sp. DSM 45814]
MPTLLLRARSIVRQAWRRLISMRTALVLLFLLALAAVPGSLLPQRPLNPAKVQTYLATHGAWGRLLDSLGAFDVFGSFWFAAVYLLLFVSLIGCLIPRIRVYARALASKPLKAPANLSRLAENSTLQTNLSPSEAAERVRGELRPRWRTIVRTEDATATRPASVTVSAEKGYSREAGNLLFHVSLLVALVLIAIGRLYSYEGSTVVTEGEGFCSQNTGLYDSYRAGSAVNPTNIKKFCIDSLDKFTATYRDDGSPSQFKADVTYHKGVDGPSQHDAITVNHPLRLEGDRVYLLNHGFSPTVTITRPGGKPITQSNAFLPQDGFLTSEGVYKVQGPDGKKADLGIEALFAPTPQDNGNGVITSAAPQADNPVLAVVAYVGDDQLQLGPQSVYVLDKSKMTQVGMQNLSVGQTMKLPDGTTVKFDGFKQWATLQVSHDPTQGYLLIAAIAMVLGLLGSLVVRRRRIWLRITPALSESGAAGSVAGEQSRTLIAVGGLARSDSGEFSNEFASLVANLNTALNVDSGVVEQPSAAVGAGAGKD